MKKLMWVVYGYAVAYNVLGTWLLMIQPSARRLWWDFFPPNDATSLRWYAMGIGPAMSLLALVVLIRRSMKPLSS